MQPGGEGKSDGRLHNENLPASSSSLLLSSTHHNSRGRFAWLALQLRRSRNRISPQLQAALPCLSRSKRHQRCHQRLRPQVRQNLRKTLSFQPRNLKTETATHLPFRTPRARLIHRYLRACMIHALQNLTAGYAQGQRHHQRTR